MASKTSPLWIENEIQKCLQQSENMETFEIAIAILSGKLQFKEIRNLLDP